jgi:hypothetical protein
MRCVVQRTALTARYHIRAPLTFDALIALHTCRVSLSLSFGYAIQGLESKTSGVFQSPSDCHVEKSVGEGSLTLIKLHTI